MKIILWLVVVPGVASVLIYFLIEFIKLADRGYRRWHREQAEAPPEDDA